MKKLVKHILIVPLYLFAVLEGFVGGTTHTKDIWDDLIKWARK